MYVSEREAFAQTWHWYQYRCISNINTITAANQFNAELILTLFQRTLQFQLCYWQSVQLMTTCFISINWVHMTTCQFLSHVVSQIEAILSVLPLQGGSQKTCVVVNSHLCTDFPATPPQHFISPSSCMTCAAVYRFSRAHTLTDSTGRIEWWPGSVSVSCSCWLAAGMLPGHMPVHVWSLHVFIHSINIRVCTVRGMLYVPECTGTFLIR